MGKFVQEYIPLYGRRGFLNLLSANPEEPEVLTHANYSGIVRIKNTLYVINLFSSNLNVVDEQLTSVLSIFGTLRSSIAS